MWAWPLPLKQPDVFQGLPREVAGDRVQVVGVEDEGSEACFDMPPGGMLRSLVYLYTCTNLVQLHTCRFMLFSTLGESMRGQGLTNIFRKTVCACHAMWSDAACAKVQQLSPVTHLQWQQSAQNCGQPTPQVDVVKPCNFSSRRAVHTLACTLPLNASGNPTE